MKRHRDHRALIPTERAAGQHSKADDRTGAIAWFNCRQKNTTATIPGALATALAAALKGKAP